MRSLNPRNQHGRSEDENAESLENTFPGYGGLAAAVVVPMWAGAVLAAEDTGGAVDPESVLHKNWRDLWREPPRPTKGAFTPRIPTSFGRKLDCKTGPGRAHPVHAKPTDDKAEVVGNGNDYVAQAKGLITLASGGFSIKGVKSETGVGVAGFHDAGILGPNEYSLQLNTNAKETTSACAGHSGCTVWQQFVYSPDYNKPGEAAVLMQYWLIGWGSSACPKEAGRNLARIASGTALTCRHPMCRLRTSASWGSWLPHRRAAMIKSRSATDPTHIPLAGKDSVLDISSVWNKAEFNVVGNAGGSRADFNKGSSITVTILLFDGSTSAPKCVADDGTTGETNNLNLGKCTASGGIPNIQFTESN